MQKPLLRKSPEAGWVLKENGLLTAFGESLVLVLMALLDRNVLTAAGAALLILRCSPGPGI